MASLAMKQGDIASAAAASDEALAITRKLAANDPNNGSIQTALALDLSRVGEAREARDDDAGAMAAIQRSPRHRPCPGRGRPPATPTASTTSPGSSTGSGK